MRQRRQMVLGVDSLESRVTPSGVTLAGSTVFIRGTSDTVVIASIDDANILHIDYGTGGPFGSLTSYTFDAATVTTIRFVGTGDNNFFDNETNTIASSVILVGDNNLVFGSLEPDFVVLVGQGNLFPNADTNDTVIIH